MRCGVAAARRSVDLATIEYREGATDYTTVLTAEQNLLEQQDLGPVQVRHDGHVREATGRGLVHRGEVMEMGDGGRLRPRRRQPQQPASLGL